MKITQYARGAIRLRSALPGRERWDVDGLKRKPFLAEELELQLSQERGVLEVKANPVTGRVLVVFDPAGGRHDMGPLLLNVLERISAGIPVGSRYAKAGTVERITTPFLGQAASSEKYNGSLFEMVPDLEDDKNLRWKASALSLTSKTFNIANSIFLAATVASALAGGFPFLSNLGLSPLAQVVTFGGLYFVSQTIESVSGYHSKMAWHRYAAEIEHQLRLKAFHHVEHLDLAFIENQSTGQLMSLIHDDAVKIRRFWEAGPHSVLTKGSALVAAGLILAWISPSVFLVSLIPLPVIYFTSRYFRKKVPQQYQAQGKHENTIKKQLLNSLSGLPTVKSFTAEEYELQELANSSQEMKETTHEAYSMTLTHTGVSQFAVMGGVALPIIYGGALVLQGTLALPAFLLQTFIVPHLIFSFEGLDRDYDLYQSAAAASHRLADILNTEAHITHGEQRLPLETVKGELRFDQVSFGYQESNEIFQGLELQVPAHQSIAFVGTTGAGKTTLIKLLLRFYEITGGRILLDGQDIRELNFFDLRGAIGVVSQDVFLFHGTVYDNILYGRPEATEEEVIAAAKAAEALSFIQDLPEGFNTIIGERGQKLSGGQQQRLSIARAVLKNPPILILDEATSAVDNETEAVIQQSIQSLSQGRTLIVIAHRLSTIRQVDWIYLLEEGRIREQGTHPDLLAVDGAYAALWRLQTGEQDPNYPLGLPLN